MLYDRYSSIYIPIWQSAYRWREVQSLESSPKHSLPSTSITPDDYLHVILHALPHATPNLRIHA